MFTYLDNDKEACQQSVRIVCEIESLTLATLCSSAVVEEVLKRPRALRLRPWPRQASTAAHSDVTAPESSRTPRRVTASSITCFTSRFTLPMRRSLKSTTAASRQKGNVINEVK